MSVKRKRDLIVDGYEFRKLCFLRDGYAVRYKLLRNGKRQILNVLLPGDLVGIPGSFLKRAVYSVTAITDLTMAEMDSFEFIRDVGIGSHQGDGCLIERGPLRLALLQVGCDLGVAAATSQMMVLIGSAGGVQLMQTIQVSRLAHDGIARSYHTAFIVAAAVASLAIFAAARIREPVVAATGVESAAAPIVGQ